MLRVVALLWAWWASLASATCDIPTFATGVKTATITAGFTTLAGFINEIGGKFLGICGWATNRAGVTEANLNTLSAHLKTLSEANGTAWIDTRASLGYTYATTDPADVADDWHLTTAGQAKQAAMIGKAYA